eukprot:9204038-Lingulodinium_polyedra.AAC.1
MLLGRRSGGARWCLGIARAALGRRLGGVALGRCVGGAWVLCGCYLGAAWVLPGCCVGAAR